MIISNLSHTRKISKNENLYNQHAPLRKRADAQPEKVVGNMTDPPGVSFIVVNKKYIFAVWKLN